MRRYRLDELPQLINVIRGEMSLVGPRPEDPAYVDLADPLHRRVFSAKPGITGLAQLEYHDEADLLAGPDADQRYRREILPAKLRLDAEYLDRRTTLLDLKILAAYRSHHPALKLHPFRADAKVVREPRSPSGTLGQAAEPALPWPGAREARMGH